MAHKNKKKGKDKKMIRCKLVTCEVAGRDEQEDGVIYRFKTAIGSAEKPPAVGTHFIMTTDEPVEVVKTGYIRAIEWTGIYNGSGGKSWDNGCVFFSGPDIYCWTRLEK